MMSGNICLHGGLRDCHIGKISCLPTTGSRVQTPIGSLNIEILKCYCDLLFAKVDSAFHPYEVGKMSTSFCDELVSRPGRVNRDL